MSVKKEVSRKNSTVVAADLCLSFENEKWYFEVKESKMNKTFLKTMIVNDLYK